MTGCDNEATTDSAAATNAMPGDTSSPPETISEVKPATQTPNYDVLRGKITYSNATLYEIRQALTDKDEINLTNTIHALYSMRRHRGALNVLDGMWQLDKNKYPELSWDLIEKIPARIAIASTLNRIDPLNADYKEYIHSQMDTPDQFTKAQIVVALGFNGDPADTDYLKNIADSENFYLVQSSITGLALMNNDQARIALVELFEKNRDNSKGSLIRDVLKQAYHWDVDKNKSEKIIPQG